MTAKCSHHGTPGYAEQVSGDVWRFHCLGGHPLGELVMRDQLDFGQIIETEPEPLKFHEALDDAKRIFPALIVAAAATVICAAAAVWIGGWR